MTIAVLNGETAGVAGSFEELQAMVGNLESQLVALYEEREGGSGPGVDADVVALYEQKLRAGQRQVDELRTSCASLEAQLRSLYEDRESGPADNDAVESLVAQLHTLYHEKEHADDHSVMVASLEAQVAALLEERNDLEAQLAAKDAEAAKALGKARDLVGAILDKTLTVN